MKISKDTFNKIETIIENNEELNTDKPGSLIFSSRESLGKCLLVKSGEVRCVDDTKTFNSLTLSKIESPSFFGISNLYGVLWNGITNRNE